jgi:hypothetical protein
MEPRVAAYTDDQAGLWDALVAESTAGTILQTRRFLSYHGDRFKDASLSFWDGADLIGVLPAARDPRDPTTVVSHPGITFGGVLHRGNLRGTEMLTALTKAAAHYAAAGYATLRYKAVPRIYQRAPAEDDLYALFRLAARRYRCDLSTAIDLSHRLEMANRRKRALQKARKSGVLVSEDACHVPALWAVLEANLSEKHGVRPVHSVKEITFLHGLFPANIRFVIAHLADEAVAGIVLFVSQMVVHTQYIASNELARETNALDLVFDWAIRIAAESGCRYFDFGISCEEQGEVLNDGLYRFKAEFGGAGIVHEFYEVSLT